MPLNDRCFNLVELEYTDQKVNSDLSPTLKTTLKTPLKGVKGTIVELLSEQPDATREYITIRTQRSMSTIKEHFKWLIANGYLQRIGPDKGGYWKVLKK
jgi:ATP-dependent DNA helicase RecG